MKKKNFTNIILILMLIVGLSLLVYPTFSDYWNSLHQSYAVASYVEEVTKMDDKKYEEILLAAKTYNQKLVSRENSYVLDEEQKEKYKKLLNISGNGIMGYIEIPKINCSLPIYHGTEEPVLQVAIGHLEWTSLPVGGQSSHCVVSGHRGLPSAKLFTDLDQMVEGDLFTLSVLDEVFTYEVDQILIVEPQEVDSLLIEEGKDYCTLVTCTPYGVNSHRLLVRGHRVENQEMASTVRVTADAIRVEPVVVAPFVALPILFILLIVLFVRHPKKKKS